jgi:hypothetical protein
MRRAAVVLAGLLLCAACGSTVRQSTSTGAAVGAGTDFTAPSAASAAPTATSDTGTTVSGGSTDTSTAGVANSGAGTGSTTVRGLTAKTSKRASGVAAAKPKQIAKTDPALAPVEVGIEYFTDTNTFAASLGSTADFGDPRVQIDLLVKYINDRGGFAGHKVVPVLYPVTIADPTPYATTVQAICESWTVDHHVVAGITPGNNSIDIQECLNKNKVVAIQAASILHDAGQYKRLPYMINPSELDATRTADVYVEGLWRQGFFKAGDKIGVFYNDYEGAQNAYKQALVPALARRGLKVEVDFAGHFPESTGGIGESAQSLQTPTLKMMAAGVTKILFMCTGCVSFVMAYAESQQYHPNYGLTSWDNAGALEAKAPAAQVKNVSGVGWNAFADVVNGHGPPPNATAKQCIDIVAPSGQAGSQASQISTLVLCDGLFSLRAAAALADKATVLTGEIMKGGFDRLGTSFLAPFSLATRLDPAHHAGVAKAQDFGWDADCPCLKYSGTPYNA